MTFIFRALLTVAVLGMPVTAAFATDLAKEFTCPAQFIDGDTFIVASKRIHLHDIDAFEEGPTCQRHNKTIDCRRISATALMDLTAGAHVKCTSASENKDGSIVAKCNTDGVDLSLNMVHTDWALVDRKVTNAYVKTEANARAKGRAMWSGSFERPWVWRAQPTAKTTQ